MRILFIVFFTLILENCSKNKNNNLSLKLKNMLDPNFAKYLSEGETLEAIKFINDKIKKNEEEFKSFIDGYGRTYAMVILDLFKGNPDELLALFNLAFDILSDENLNQTKSEDGDSLLHLAIKNGHDEVIIKIIDKVGIDLNIFNFSKESPLCLAIKMGKKSIIEKFINKDETLLNQEINDEGDKPFMAAIRYNKFEVLKSLWALDEVSHNNLVNYKNNKQLLPLILAIDSRNIDMVEFLLNKGADPSMKTMNITPLIWAGHKKYKGIVEILLAAGGKFESKTHINSKLVSKILGDVAKGLNLGASGMGVDFGFSIGEISDDINQHLKERHGILLDKNQIYNSNNFIESVYNEYNWVSKVNNEDRKKAYELALSEVIDSVSDFEDHENELIELFNSSEQKGDKDISDIIREFSAYRKEVNNLKNTYSNIIKEVSTHERIVHKVANKLKKLIRSSSVEKEFKLKHYEIITDEMPKLQNIYASIRELIKKRETIIELLKRFS